MSKSKKILNLQEGHTFGSCLRLSTSHSVTIFVYFPDPDNDKVVFSTDEELVEALGYVSDGVFRVHVIGE